MFTRACFLLSTARSVSLPVYHHAGVSVGFNFLSRDFFNAIAAKDADAFTRLLLAYVAAIAGAIPVFVWRDYSQSVLSLRWRTWLTDRYVGRYMASRNYYRIATQSAASSASEGRPSAASSSPSAVIDNPDQRINADIGAFTGNALDLALTVLRSGVDLISFSGILFGIYKPLFFVLLVYALGGTALSLRLGQGLVPLNFAQEAREADFRFALVRVRENAESIAFYGGEGTEAQLLRSKFAAAVENLKELLIASRNLGAFTSFYRFIISVLPAAVIAPLYFKGDIEFGVINQSSSAFNHILGDVSLIVFQFEALAGFAATVDRIGQFEEALAGGETDEQDSERVRGDATQLASAGTIARRDISAAPSSAASAPLLRVTALSLPLPRPATNGVAVAADGSFLVRDLTFDVSFGDSLLLCGPSGCGKTSVLRALAGLWTSGQGDVTMTRDVAFLPQRPYMALGTLRQQLLYPTWSTGLGGESGCGVTATGSSHAGFARLPPTDDELLAMLRSVQLGDLATSHTGLDATTDWALALSVGEQQRLALARCCLARPALALLDESTSALDGPSEAAAYALLRKTGVTCVSVGHRNSLMAFHSRVLRLGLGPNGDQWALGHVDTAPGGNGSGQTGKVTVVATSAGLHMAEGGLMSVLS